jgi:hypothetical protein
MKLHFSKTKKSQNLHQNLPTFSFNVLISNYLFWFRLKRTVPCKSKIELNQSTFTVSMKFIKKYSLDQISLNLTQLH